jgi:hypothetical protein
MTIVRGDAAPTILTGKDFGISNGKALINSMANLSVRGIIFQDAKVPDQNGAGIRPEPGFDLTVEGCEFTRCENGILTPAGAGSVSLISCNFHDNGAGDAHTHEIYIGGLASVLAMNSTFTCGTKSTHAFKTRAKSTTLRGCTFKGSIDDTGGVGGSVLDFAEGGEVLIEDCTVELFANAEGNALFVGYLMENQNAGVKTVTLNNVNFIDHTGTGGVLMAKGGDLVIGPDCTFVGPTAPTMQGWTNVTGQLVAQT